MEEREKNTTKEGALFQNLEEDYTDEQRNEDAQPLEG